MKSPKFMGKEEAIDLTVHTRARTHTHTMAPTTIPLKQLCESTAVPTCWTVAVNATHYWYNLSSLLMVKNNMVVLRSKA